MTTERPAFIISGDMNITLILEGQTHSIGTSHANHGRILEALKAGDWDALPTLVSLPKTLAAVSSGQVTVNEFGEVAYGGEPVHNTVAKRITLFFQNGLDFMPLVKFLENLMNNPSRRAVEELYGFLENEGMPITEDGCFVGYKAVREDYLDIHSGSFSNKPGDVHVMPRNLVDDDARKSCSNGFHIGSQQYAVSFGGSQGRIMLVKVNPADAVSVPYDGCEKLRACRYEVIQEVDRSTILQSPLFEQEPGLFEEEETEESECFGCGEPAGWCICDDYDPDADNDDDWN
jgi:hypothetical protein